MKIYFVELTDLYEKKNIPKVVYMIHALAYGTVPHMPLARACHPPPTHTHTPPRLLTFDLSPSRLRVCAADAGTAVIFCTRSARRQRWRVSQASCSSPVRPTPLAGCVRATCRSTRQLTIAHALPWIARADPESELDQVLKGLGTSALPSFNNLGASLDKDVRANGLTYSMLVFSR